MKKELNKTLKPMIFVSNYHDEAIKVTVTAILMLFGAWAVIKLSKEMLKELEGMGL